MFSTSPGWLAAALIACALPAHAEHRALQPLSPMVRGIHDQPVPSNPDAVRVMAAVLHHAHDPGAPYLAGYAVYRALLHLAGETEPAPHNVAQAILDMRIKARMVGALRARLLQDPVHAEVLQEADAAAEPRAHGWRFRHEGGAMWARDDGGTHRVLGVRMGNASGRELLGGRFTLHLEPSKRAFRFECAWSGALAPGETRVVGCYGDNSIPAAEALETVRAVAAGGVRARREHHEVAFQLGGERFEVRRHEASFGDDRAMELRAEEMIAKASCSERGGCGIEARGQLKSQPGLPGLLAGLVAGLAYLLARWAAGTRAARWFGGAMAVAIVVVAASAFVVIVGIIWRGPGLLVGIVGLLAFGAVLELIAGFGMGFAAVMVAGRVWRQARAGGGQEPLK